MTNPYPNIGTETRNIIGFCRGKDETIEAIVSDSHQIRTDRNLGECFLGCVFGWDPHRKAQIVPLRVEKPKIKAFKKSNDYEALPEQVREVFDAGSILRTSSDKDSEFSALMYATNESKPQGRTGVLLYKRKPVVVKQAGKEFVVEIKGVGVPNGNNSITDLQTRMSYFGSGHARWGGLEVAQGRREFRNLEILRNEKSIAFRNANSPRAALLVEYDGELRYCGDSTDQAYLLRLSPSSVRASFNGNDAFPKIKNKPNATAMGLAQQFVEMMTLDSMLIHTCAHSENLVLTNDGYKFTDFSDMRTLAELADPHEIIRLTFRDYIDEVPDRTKRDIEDYCRELSKGLGIKWRTELKRPKALAEEIWKSYIAPCAFEIRRNGCNGSRQEVFRQIEEIGGFEDILLPGAIDRVVLDRAQRYLKNREKDVRQAEECLADLDEYIPQFAAIQGDVKACRNFFAGRFNHLPDGQLLGLAKNEYKQRLDGKPRCEARLDENKRLLELARKHINSPREFAKFNPEVVPRVGFALYQIKGHLEREVDLLETVRGDIADASLRVARARIGEIGRLLKDTYGVIGRLRKDPNYLLKLSVLPYEKYSAFKRA
ncbi:MAG: hypothetical protein KJ955_00305 [Nanoarchaeota archaeon]|nr:hypothetical protein [Nanoarchaeota archaeon]